MGEPAQSTTDKVTREDLNAKASDLGVENPEGLKNMEAVEEAIRDAEEVPRFSRQEVLDNARALTGFSRNHMVGALHGNKAEAFTAESAKRIGKKFADRKQESA